MKVPTHIWIELHFNFLRRRLFLLFLGYFLLPAPLRSNTAPPSEYELRIIHRKKKKVKVVVNYGDPIAIWLQGALGPIRGVVTHMEPDSIGLGDHRYAVSSIDMIRLQGKTDKSRDNHTILGVLGIITAVPMGLISGIGLSLLFTGDFSSFFTGGLGIALSVSFLILNIILIANAGKYKSKRFSFVIWQKGVPPDGVTEE